MFIRVRTGRGGRSTTTLNTDHVVSYSQVEGEQLAIQMTSGEVIRTAMPESDFESVLEKAKAKISDETEPGKQEKKDLKAAETHASRVPSAQTPLVDRVFPSPEFSAQSSHNLTQEERDAQTEQTGQPSSDQTRVPEEQDKEDLPQITTRRQPGVQSSGDTPARTVTNPPTPTPTPPPPNAPRTATTSTPPPPSSNVPTQRPASKPDA